MACFVMRWAVSTTTALVVVGDGGDVCDACMSEWETCRLRCGGGDRSRAKGLSYEYSGKELLF